MTTRPRLYDAVLAEHLRTRRQMALVIGPRQVGKTTVCRHLGTSYLSWDDLDHRRVLLRGPAAVAEHAGISRLSDRRPVLVLDELHKFRGWRGLLKGLFDTYGERVGLLVTGSSRLEGARRGGDSLMGRYLTYRMHPFTVGEVVSPALPDEARPLRAPLRTPSADWEALWVHGGFPEPYVARDPRFTRRWSRLRRDQLLREDVRDWTRLQEVGQLEALALLLSERSGSQLVYAQLAREVQVGIATVRRWIDVLARLHHGFLLRPWTRNVARSLRKEPKWYLRDWSGIADPGARTETFVACHLLKAVETWEDLGLGAFHLGYLRDKERHEVDFVVVRDGRPWILVEAKHADEALSPALARFQAMTRAPHAFQVVLEADHVAADPMTRTDGPLVVPARTFLSMLP